MKKRFKPIVLINEKHEVIQDHEKLSGELFDIAQIISQDEGNALSFDNGLFYSRCACPEYRYFVIETAPFPHFASDKIQSRFSLSSIRVEKVVYEARPKENLGINLEPVSASVSIVTGYLENDSITESVSIALTPISAMVKNVTGYKNYATGEHAYVYLEPAKSQIKTLVKIENKQDSIHSHLTLSGGAIKG